MLRITRVESSNDAITLRLEGRLSGPWVGELSEACEKAMREGNGLALNLAEVSFLDPEGIDLLATLQSRGAKVVDCSIFVSEQLKSLRLIPQPPA